MFARFCGFGPGHKSTHHETKVFRDEIKEVFGLGKDGMGDAIQPRDEDLEDGSQLDKLDGDSESNSENSENGEESDEDLSLLDHDEDYFAIEEELGYAPL
jgi:hypothetical protein